MARITVEDCLEQVPNRFTLILVAAERSKQLLTGSSQLIDDDRENKEIVTALREVAAGVVAPDLTQFDENMLLHAALAREEAAIASITAANQGEATSGIDGELPPEIDADLPPEATD